MQLQVEVDKSSGFCFGVIRAIEKAETELNKHPLFCLGDIVHNNQEMNRLKVLGLKTISYKELETITNSPILLRAHGEPPSTYKTANRNNNLIIDATCPVVLNLQRQIRQVYQQIVNGNTKAQIVILGKVGHAEVIGLQGQTNNTAIVIQDENDINIIDFSTPIYLFTQTTTSLSLFESVVKKISHRIKDKTNFIFKNTICRNVIHRLHALKNFVKDKDVVIFVGGVHSSNAKYLFEQCKTFNPNSFFLSDVDENGIQTLKPALLNFRNTQEMSIGICGATSTPQWLMEQVRQEVVHLLKPLLPI